MADLKQISANAISAALEKALHYRLLNEPMQAESICRDVLEVDANNQNALITLLLALSDQFETEFSRALNEAKALLARVQGQYEQLYYGGVINERWAMAQIARDVPIESAHQWLREAMRCYEKADALSGTENPDATLRWNACVRVLNKHQIAHAFAPASKMHAESEFGDEVPPR